MIPQRRPGDSRSDKPTPFGRGPTGNAQWMLTILLLVVVVVLLFGGGGYWYRGRSRL
ncbi:MAG TPA: hypothetical protein VGI06_08445 [Acidimicrobiales bacterium]